MIRRDSPSKKRFGVLLGAFFCALPSLCADDFGAWRQRAAITTSTDDAFVAIELTPAVLDKCERLDLADLRIADAKGIEVPYAIVRAQEKHEDRELKGRELNRDRPDAKTSRLTLDFRSSQEKNRITVRTAGTNFRRRVRVEGSTDQTTWAELVKEGWLFAVGRGKRFESIDIGENTYRYLRVWVAGMPEEVGAPRIEAVTCRYRVVKKPAETSWEASIQETSEDPKTRTTTALVDFGTRHLPIVGIELRLARDPQRVFRRTCKLWGRNTSEHTEQDRFETGELAAERTVETPWRHVGTGELFRDASGQESLEIRQKLPYRYVKIQIHNADSPPLELGGVKVILHPVHAVFEPAGGKRFSIYCGNRSAISPSYEARATLVSLDPGDLPKAELGKLVEQASAMPPPSSGSQTIVWVLMGLAVLATAALLLYTAAAVRREDGAVAQEAVGGLREAGEGASGEASTNSQSKG